MPNTRSAAKQSRAAIRRRGRNTTVKTAVKSVEKNIRTLVSTGKKEEAAKKLASFQSRVDRAVKSGVLHKNNASRRKARLTALLAKKA